MKSKEFSILIVHHSAYDYPMPDALHYASTLKFPRKPKEQASKAQCSMPNAQKMPTFLRYVPILAKHVINLSTKLYNWLYVFQEKNLQDRCQSRREV